MTRFGWFRSCAFAAANVRTVVTRYVSAGSHVSRSFPSAGSDTTTMRCSGSIGVPPRGTEQRACQRLNAGPGVQLWTLRASNWPIGWPAQTNLYLPLPAIRTASLALTGDPRIYFLPEHFERHAAGLEHEVVEGF